MAHMSDMWVRPALTALVAVVAAMAGIVAAAARSPAVAATPDVSLSTDATGALVTATRITPGTLPARCVRVSYADATGGEALALYATAYGNGLAQYLDVTIDVGRGGGYASCTGFRPASGVYRGTVAELAQNHGDGANAVTAAMLAAGSGDATFRFRFSLRDTNAAQGLTAGADFVWFARPPLAPVPAPTQFPTPAGNPPPMATASALPVPPPSSPPPSSPPPSSPPPSSPSLSSVPPGPSVSVPLTPTPPPRKPNIINRVYNAVRDAAVPVVRGTAFGLATLPLVLTFLVVQSRIDRRDPKLALAPAHPDPDLGFDDVPRSAR